MERVIPGLIARIAQLLKTLEFSVTADNVVHTFKKGAKMTAIARVGTSTPELNSLKRTVNIVKGDHLPTLKNVELTVEQKAELAQTKAISAAATAASQKQIEEAQKILNPNSREIYLSSITDLSLESAQKTLGIVEQMANNKEDVGFNVHGRYGDQKITDLKTYVSALRDYIGKYPSAEAQSITSSLPSTAAASIYRQMQDMVAHDGLKT
jgi:hypothetical protein